ncbi:hypothetical protein HK100_009870, partial [Physocladia obscura]
MTKLTLQTLLQRSKSMIHAQQSSSSSNNQQQQQHQQSAPSTPTGNNTHYQYAYPLTPIAAALQPQTPTPPPPQRSRSHQKQQHLGSDAGSTLASADSQALHPRLSSSTPRASEDAAPVEFVALPIALDRRRSTSTSRHRIGSDVGAPRKDQKEQQQHVARRRSTAALGRSLSVVVAGTGSGGTDTNAVSISSDREVRRSQTTGRRKKDRES